MRRWSADANSSAQPAGINTPDSGPTRRRVSPTSVATTALPAVTLVVLVTISTDVVPAVTASGVVAVSHATGVAMGYAVAAAPAQTTSVNVKLDR